jgi:hypothetical protein
MPPQSSENRGFHHLAGPHDLEKILKDRRTDSA